MIQPIRIQLDIKEVVPGYLVDKHHAIYKDDCFRLLKVEHENDDLFLQDGPHVQLLQAHNHLDDKEAIQKIISILQGKSAWWLLTEILDLSEEINFNLEIE